MDRLPAASAVSDVQRLGPPMTLSVTSPVTPYAVASIVGSGYALARTRVKLDGTIIATLELQRTGVDAFRLDAHVSATPRTSSVTVEQYTTIGGVTTWREVDRAPLIVQAVASPPVASTIRFGMAAHFMWQPLSDTISDLDRMKAAGMTYARFDVGWRWGEPQRATYDQAYLGRIDAVLDACQARGFRTTITVIETPAWANTAGIAAPPTNPADYASFVGMLARRTANRPDMVWEVWNEENDPHFWTTGVNVNQYAALLAAAYRAIKLSDPDSTVLVGGLLFNDLNFLNGIYSSASGPWFDGIAIHPYCLAHPPADQTQPYYSFAASVAQFTKVLADHLYGAKPIYITEMGWGTDKVSDAVRATYLRDAVAIARGWPNVKGMAAYTLHQSQFPTYGLLTTANQPTASWTAYAGAVA